MNLLENPFFQLSATTRDNRQRINELADELSLLLDDTIATAARSELCTPRKRLKAEIAWLPGISRNQTAQLLSSLDSSPEKLLTQAHLPAITRVNLLIAGLEKMAAQTAEEVSEWIFELAVVFETIDAGNLQCLINEERIVSGFPEVTDLSLIEEELGVRKQHCRTIITRALDLLPTKDMIRGITELVSMTTHDASTYSPQLITELVDYYEIESQTFFAEEKQSIDSLLNNIEVIVGQEIADEKTAPLFTQLTFILKNWNTVSLPIQIHKKSLGLVHNESLEVAGNIRSLSITLFNEHYKIDLAQKLTNILLTFFPNITEIIERVHEDAETLKKHADEVIRHQRAELEQQKIRQQEITWEGEVGTLFKEKLRISPEGIFWKKKQWPLDAINWIRWGGVRHSVNGIPTGTKYTIMYGSGIRSESIEIKNKTIFTAFTDRLWRAVGVRILTEMLKELQRGVKLHIGAAVVSDYGVELERKRFMSSPERLFCPWSTVSLWEGAGAIFLGKKDDKRFSVALPYLDLNNVHVLETAVRLMFKSGGTKLSSLLQD